MPELNNKVPINNNDDDIVISGISGRFPDCDSMEELKEKLLNGIDLINEDETRWPAGLHGLPARYGKIKDLSKFDAQFFGVHSKLTDITDPQLRILLEVTHEAIMDAGINPNELRGTRTGVFIGLGFSESIDYWTRDPDMVTPYGLLGCCRAMWPNRISYTFDLLGPSFAVETACSSSLYSFQHAVNAIKTGQCDAAIVGGCNIILKPIGSLQFMRLGMLSDEGKCKVFDSEAGGYVRSEAVGAILLQKAANARRIYATVLGAKTNCDGHKKEGITFPSGLMQKRLMEEIYEQVGVNPHDVAYLEAHGTGTKIGDPQEMNSVGEFFCKNRSTPLLVGSIKSNMGHAETASGVCSLAKVLISMEGGIIPRNLHFNTPNPEIPALSDGRLKVVQENTQFNGGIVAINSFGFGGANVHVILRSNGKIKRKLTSSLKIPHVVAVSGRTKEAVQHFLDKINQHRDDEEFLALVYKAHSQNIIGHFYRGYSILKDEAIVQIDEIGTDKRPICFIFSGMGSQWAGMAKDLMKFDIFKRSIARCAVALQPHGVDLEDIMVNTNETFENILHSFISITAMQIALTDMLKLVGIEPDFMVGHSLGEVGCAYADGTLTAEQAILASYSRGRSVLDIKLPRGAMAAVGLTWDEAKRRCTNGIVPACHNSKDSVTISGPFDAVNQLLEELKAENIFAKLVNSSFIAFHSEYIAESGPILRKALEAIIPDGEAKPRTSRWLSSSIPEANWTSPLAQLSSTEYHVNNFLSPVLFHEALGHLPKNCIAIELAPTGLLQAILRRALGPNTTNISLVKRGDADNAQFLASSLGKIYSAGAQPKFENLYPSVTFPVSCGTPMLNSMIEWDHSFSWPVASYSGKNLKCSENIITIDLSEQTDQFYAGHVIDGKIQFPASGYLTLVWKSFAVLLNYDYEQNAILFEDVQFHKSTYLPKDGGTVKYKINIFEGSGEFELSESGLVIVTGKISIPEDLNKEILEFPKATETDQSNSPQLLPLNQTDIYKELRSRGYNYNGIFQGISHSDNFGINGKIKWENNWTTLLDAIFQFSILGDWTREIKLPSRIQRLFINPKEHLTFLAANNNNNNKKREFNVHVYKNIDIIKCGGIELRGLKSNSIPKRDEDKKTDEAETEIVQTEHAYLNTLIQGNLASLKWIQNISRNNNNNSNGRELCHVYYAPVNYQDILVASGKLTSNEGNLNLGLEFSGRDSKGQRIIGIVSGNALATTVSADPTFLWKVPDKWSLEEAATVPLAYFISYYSLIVRGALQSGESILIHQGSGDVGQAAISIALHMNCKIFTTCANQAEKSFLMQKFPQLAEDNVGNVSSCFEDMVLNRTNRKGVDVVLNSLDGAKFQASLRCLGMDGRFLEIGKMNLNNNSTLGMNVFLRNISFHGICIDALFEGGLFEREEVGRLLNDGIQSGVVKPLPYKVFNETEAAQAFKFAAAAGAHSSHKVLIKIRDEELSRIVERPLLKKLMAAVSRIYMNEKKSYIVLNNGLEEEDLFGLELANWLIERGAKNIVLTSLEGAIKTGYQSLRIRRWRENGIKVLIIKIDDLNTKENNDAKVLLEESNKLGPVGGIFVLTPIDETILDAAIKILAPELDYFFNFSSIFAKFGVESEENEKINPYSWFKSLDTVFLQPQSAETRKFIV